MGGSIKTATTSWPGPGKKGPIPIGDVLIKNSKAVVAGARGG